jgi:hypothetical protein
MKLTGLNTLFKNAFLDILMVMLLFLGTSCAKKVSFLTSSVVPAARGYVQVKNDKNKNYVIQIHLSSLAEVTRLQPAKKTYVVWMEADQQMMKNIGQIKSSMPFMSKKLGASFETVSSIKPNKIIITAEDDASIQFPSEQVVLSTDRF